MHVDSDTAKIATISTPTNDDMFVFVPLRGYYGWGILKHASSQFYMSFDSKKKALIQADKPGVEGILQVEEDAFTNSRGYFLVFKNNEL